MKSINRMSTVFGLTKSNSNAGWRGLVKKTLVLLVVVLQLAAANYALALGLEMKQFFYDGPAGGEDHGVDVAFDASRNYFIVGSTYVAGQGLNYIVWKYNDANELLWSKTFNGAANGDDVPTAMAVDNAGNVFITGSSWSPTQSFNYATVGYGPNGNPLWAPRIYDYTAKEDRAVDIAVDNAGGVYVTGRANYLGLDFDFKTIKYDSLTGDLRWHRTYNNVNAFRDDKAVGIAADKLGNVFVTGVSDANKYSPSNFDIVTIRYDRAGNPPNTTRYNVGSLNDEPTDIAVDNLGNAYVSGTRSRTDGVNPHDALTLKVNSTGLAWAKVYTATPDDVANAIAADSTGNVYVAGRTTPVGSAQIQDGLVIAYDTNGNQRWAKAFTGFNHSGPEELTDIALTLDGNPIATGTTFFQSAGDPEFGGWTNSSYATVEYYKTNGTQVAWRWADAGHMDRATAIAVSVAGHALVTGTTQSPLSDNILSVKYYR